MSGTERPARIELMDALRGLAVCLMVLHHFLYDLCEFLGAPWWLFTNPVFDVLHYFFAGTVHLSLRYQLGFFSQQPQSVARKGDGARPRHHARDLFYGHDHRVRRAASACKRMLLFGLTRILEALARVGAAYPSNHV